MTDRAETIVDPSHLHHTPGGWWFARARSPRVN
jgi:hypothetical protein